MNILNDVEASSVLSLKSVQPVRDAGITIENEKKKKKVTTKTYFY